MQVRVQMRLPDTRVVELAPEAIIGRMRSATLRLNDPAISEAHAMVSLRGASLRLLALRGRFEVDGRQLADIALSPGQRIVLTPQIALDVVSVSIPPEIIGIRARDLPLQVLPPVASIAADTGDVGAGFHPEAAAVLWLDGDVVYLRDLSGTRPETTLAMGEAFDVAERTYVLERMRLEAADAPATQRGHLDEPLTLKLMYDSVHIEHGPHVAAVDGLPARILCELAEIGAPVEWRTVAREVWPHEVDDGLLRRNWDACLARLRRALLEQGVRGDLVRAAGRGRVELFLRAGDTVDDRQ